LRSKFKSSIEHQLQPFQYLRVVLWLFGLLTCSRCIHWIYEDNCSCWLYLFHFLLYL